MKRGISKAAAAAFVVLAASAVCAAQSGGGDQSLVTEGTFKGSLSVGKTDSYILHVGQESGDFAALCFPNRSEVGRAILAACKKGAVCEFKGAVDQGAECKKVDKATRAVLSGSGKILSVESVRAVAPEKRRRAPRRRRRG